MELMLSLRGTTAANSDLQTVRITTLSFGRECKVDRARSFAFPLGTEIDMDILILKL